MMEAINNFPILCEGVTETSAVLLLLAQQTKGGIFSRITMTSMTGAWYHRLTPIESVLVGLIILQIFIMRYYLILPLNITKLIDDGTLISTSVKKKRSTASHCSPDKEKLSETLFKVLRKLDQHDCLLLSLCELQRHSMSGNRLPAETASTLSSLNRLGKKRRRLVIPSNETVAERPVIAIFEEAVLTATEDAKTFVGKMDNSSYSSCQLRYSLCPLTGKEIIEHLQPMWHLSNS